MNNRRKNDGELKLIPQHVGEKKATAKDYACIPCSTTFLRWFIGILALIAAFTILPVIIVQYYQNGDEIANQRCGVNVPFSGSSSNVSLTGMIQLNTNTRLMIWNLRGIGANVNDISSISVFDYLGTPLFTACGVTVVCQMNNQVIQTDPVGLSLSPFMYQIRALPFNYYYNITSTTFGNAIGQFCVN
jgi:hypothetical protein